MMTPARSGRGVICLPDVDDMVIASPLPFLFEEDRHGDRQAREALFCTFNADLGYFERTVLGVTQSAGARVTVVGDGRISDPDPRAARNAGTRYVHGLAVTGSGAAFHSKVTVIAGSERAMVAIGSGNLSPGGWHLNEETWTVATADREGCPAIVTQVAAWLRTLDQVCAITPQAVQGIGRTATLLERLAAWPSPWTPVTASCTPAPGVCWISCRPVMSTVCCFMRRSTTRMRQRYGSSSNACGPTG